MPTVRRDVRAVVLRNDTVRGQRLDLVHVGLDRGGDLDLGEAAQPACEANGNVAVEGLYMCWRTRCLNRLMLM